MTSFLINQVLHHDLFVAALVAWPESCLTVRRHDPTEQMDCVLLVGEGWQAESFLKMQYKRWMLRLSMASA